MSKDKPKLAEEFPNTFSILELTQYELQDILKKHYKDVAGVSIDWDERRIKVYLDGGKS